MVKIEELVTVTSKDGTPIACWHTGQGPPLVLIHGTSADHTRWNPVLPAFEAHFTVYAVDRRGRGASGDSDKYAIEREFEDVAAVVDSIKEPVNLLGHSYGAICALEAALLTRNIRKLVLYEPPIPMGVEIFSPGIIDRLQALLDSGDREGVVKTFMLEVARVPLQQVELLRSLPAWETRIAAAHTIPREERADRDYRFVQERFRKLSTATLLLLGGDSPPFFKAAINILNSVLPVAQIVVMPGQQHAAMDTGTALHG
jgi:pimeloyl-ACP methyl ester carboxylesterase